MTPTHDMFCTIADVWTLYAARKISMRRRDAMLADLRACLRPTSDPLLACAPLTLR
jgi:hypothetical protein